MSWHLPLLAPGIINLLDVTVVNGRVRELSDAALAAPTRFIEPGVTAWITNPVRLMACNISPGTTFDVAATTFAARTRHPNRFSAGDPAHGAFD